MGQRIRTGLSRRAWLLAACLMAIPMVGMTARAAEDKIIVSGASGQLGELTVKALLQRGVKPSNLILVTRTPEKLADYARQGASVRFGDLTQPESLPAAYAGGTRMVMISAGQSEVPRPELQDRGFKAAVQAGVKHIAYTSIIIADADIPLAKDHRGAEDKLKASGAKWTMLRNGQYFEYMVLPTAIEMAKTGKALVPFNESKTVPITRADCAAAAAVAMTSAKYENTVLPIGGAELVGMEDIANAVSAITGKQIVVTRQTEAEATAASSGMSAGMSLPAPSTTSIIKDMTGRPATGLREFLTSHKAELLAAAGQ